MLESVSVRGGRDREREEEIRIQRLGIKAKVRKGAKMVARKKALSVLLW